MFGYVQWEVSGHTSEPGLSATQMWTCGILRETLTSISLLLEAESKLHCKEQRSVFKPLRRGTWNQLSAFFFPVFCKCPQVCSASVLQFFCPDRAWMLKALLWLSDVLQSVAFCPAGTEESRLSTGLVQLDREITVLLNKGEGRLLIPDKEAMKRHVQFL